MESDTSDLHALTSAIFQNVSNLSPALKILIVNAKQYLRSMQVTCSMAVNFIESLHSLATAASISEGSTKIIGDVLLDIIDGFKEVENMKLELMKLFINEVIIPLESQAECEIDDVKVAEKGYLSNNKNQVEVVSKARLIAVRAQKKTVSKKKHITKYENEEKQKTASLKEEEKKLKELRQQGLRKALVEERKVYCFIAERVCAYGRGMILYNNRITSFVEQRLPDWLQIISNPTDLPPESELIITNPANFKIGTVGRHSSTRGPSHKSVLKGLSFNVHFPTRYSTLDLRGSGGGSRQSLSAVSVRSGLYASSETPRALSRQGFTSSTLRAAPLAFDCVAAPPSNDSERPLAGKQSALPLQQLFIDGVSDSRKCSPSVSKSSSNHTLIVPARALISEYAKLAGIKADESVHPNLSGVVPRQGDVEEVDSRASEVVELKPSLPLEVASPKLEVHEKIEDFSARFSQIQLQLEQNFTKAKMEPASKTRLKALYDHAAQDASQLDFQTGDLIKPLCEQVSGWQYGENATTERVGWFPAAYAEEILVVASGQSTPNVAVIQTTFAPAPFSKPRPGSLSCSSAETTVISAGDTVPHTVTVSCAPAKPPRSEAEQRVATNTDRFESDPVKPTMLPPSPASLSVSNNHDLDGTHLANRTAGGYSISYGRLKRSVAVG